MSRVVDLEAFDSSAFGGFIIEGDSAGDGAGFSVSAAGDVNGDGIDDFLIGAPFHDHVGGEDEGAAYVIYGRAGSSGPIDLGNLQPPDGFMIRGDASWDRAGFSVSGAGDINGDGFDDIVVGASGYGGFYYGGTATAYVIFGHATGTPIDLAHLAPSDGFVIHGQYSHASSISVAAAGDINGDGLDDIIVGMSGNNNNAGAAYVIFGKAAGFGNIDVANLGSNGFALHGDSSDLSHFGLGASVAGVGDINGDGFDDIIVTESRRGLLGYGSQPSAYVIFGKQGGFATVDLSHLTPSDGFQITGQFDYGNAHFSVSGAGDVNGDGFADIVIGSSHDNYGGGAAYVIFGRAAGFSNIDLEHLAGSAGFTVLPDAGHDLTGFAVHSAGDVNGDGFDDIIIGAPHGDDGGANAGEAYVIFGRATGFGTIDLAHLAPRDGFIVRANVADDQAGLSVSGGADLNGDGIADVIVGVPFGDRGGLNAGQAYVIFGSPALQAHATNDFNHDGVSDIIWRDASGTMSEWLGTRSGGFQWNQSGGFAVGTDWTLLGFGDFNGDGRDDILWRQPATGLVQEWLGLANGSFAWNVNYAVPTSQAFAVTADFNGDGRDDVMWRLADGTLSEWLGQANGGFQWNQRGSFQQPTDWNVIESADFNGDGIDDLLWRQDGSGKVMEWLGNNQGGFAWLANFDLPSSYHLVGAGDFNGDGVSDIMWRASDGTLSEWLGQGNGGFHWNQSAAFAVSNDWHSAGIGDYNGDGRDDLLWQTSTGHVYQWLGQTNGGFVWNQAVQYDVGTNIHVQPVADHFL